MQTVAVIGQGVVGRSLSNAIFNSKKYNLFGIDNNEALVKALSSTLPYPVSSNYQDILNADIIIVCVPTDIAKSDRINTHHLLNVVKDASPFLKDNSLFIIESTVPIGTTEYVMSLIHKTNNSIHVAFSPERIDPGNKFWNVTNTPKIVSGTTEKSLQLAAGFYYSFINDVVVSRSTKEAESAKLLENAYRLINISFINEYSILLDTMGISINNVLDLAETKPFGFARFNPGIGAGGDCIPVDPTFIIDAAKETGFVPNILNAAIAINTDMVGYFEHLALLNLGTLKDKNICVVGISYKPNTFSVSNSPGLRLIERLSAAGANVSWHDNLVKEYNGITSSKISANDDLIIVVHRHDNFDNSILDNLNVIDCERLV